MSTKLLLALDLGTTTLAGRLFSADGSLCAEATLFNPQAPFGADVLRRMEASLAGDGEALQAALQGGIDALVTQLLHHCQAERSSIVRAAAAGNPAICCLLQGLPVQSLLYPPHRPPADISSWLHLDCLPVPLFLFPPVSGYVGGDLVAVLYGFSPCDDNSFFVDVGTNGEMALYAKGQWWVTSVAAGPAFEGGNVGCGMVASAGAITGVSVEDDRLVLQVRGGGLPRGLCGSGLTDLIGVALETGLIARDGTIADVDDLATNLSRYISYNEQGRTLCLYRDAATCLELTQDDIRQFQLAKGAIYAGTECLLARAEITAEQLSVAVVTGALGFSIGRQSLKAVSMLPEDVIGKVTFVDGGVIAGLCRYLLHAADAENSVQQLAGALRPYPLSGTPHFEKAFVAALNFANRKIEVC